jgi:hypothetical protein
MLYKSSCKSEGNRVRFKDFLRGSEIGYEPFDREFFVKMSVLTLGGCNFLAFNPFLLIFSVTDVRRGGLRLLSGHPKQWGPPANSEKTLP